MLRRARHSLGKIRAAAGLRCLVTETGGIREYSRNESVT